MNQNRSVTSSSTALYNLISVSSTEEGGEWRRNVFLGLWCCGIGVNDGHSYVDDDAITIKNITSLIIVTNKWDGY